MGARKSLKIAELLSRVREMVYGSEDSRATALANLKDSESGDPFRILIGTILSHRTRDENTTRAVENLFSRYKNVRELADANPDEVRQLIKPAGFYNMKTRSIIRVSRQLLEEFGGSVPRNVDDLLKLHSVGRKTANCVLVYAFNMPAIPVDTHVHRISNRLGLVNTKEPEETETELTKSVPKRYWLDLNDLFVRFGQTTCRPVGPRCDLCSLTGVCKYYKTVVAPKRKLLRAQTAASRHAVLRGSKAEGGRARRGQGIR
jgi:endonuclease-3